LRKTNSEFEDDSPAKGTHVYVVKLETSVKQTKKGKWQSVYISGETTTEKGKIIFLWRK
jgi:hypothetical protein